MAERKNVYTVADLRVGALPNRAKLAVIGAPIAHSRSPQMHQAALDALGVELEYIRLFVESEELGEAVALMRERGFRGCNVTIPHKLGVIELCSELTPEAEAMGAVNTLIFNNENDEAVRGHNTDGSGLEAALREELGTELAGARVLILGAGGGAGKAVAAHAQLVGCASLWVSNRTKSKVEELAAVLNERGSTCVQAIGNETHELLAALAEVDVVINATSLGMKPEDALPLPVEGLTQRHVVYDAIYSPPETALLRAAKERGAKVANGLSMLIHQGALSFVCWLGTKPDVAVMRGALD